MRKIILFLQIILMLPLALHAQNKTITGTVKDVGGVLPGATVSEKGIPTNGVSVDMNGKFKITLRGTSNVLIAKYIGYTTREINVGSDANLDIVLQPNSQGLDEVTVVGFSPKKRITNVGAVSSISGAEIRTIPTANVQNTLMGRLPGIVSVQSSGQPGRDASDFFIRGVSSLNAGNRPLILVDDIEYTYEQLQQINVNEIETINILKDASTTAIYGIKGANGVLVVTTRRGKSGSPKFNLRLEGGVQSPTRTPKFLDSYNAALLINESQMNDAEEGTTPNLSFTEDDLQKFRDGSDPYGHPNTNWYKEIFRKATYQANTNLDISGGTDQVKYFISAGAFNQNGNVKNFNDPQALVNTNYYFTRYNFRSNLDLKATKTLNLRLDVTTRFADINQPGQDNPIGTIYDFRRQTPFSAPFLNPNGTFAYNYSPFTKGADPTLNASLASNGYNHERRTDFNVLLGAVQNLDFITEGLTLTGRVAYASIEAYNKGATNFSTFPTYHYDPVTDSYSLKPDASYVVGSYLLTGSTSIYTKNTNIQFFSNYDRTFGDHHFRGLVLFNQYSIDNQANIPSKFRGYSGEIGYDYKQKILFTANVGYNGTDRFASNKRYGLFPAFGLGYVLSREEFFKKAFPSISLFKIRGSYGIVGSDGVPNSQYIFLQNYSQVGGGYNFGSTRKDYNTIFEGSLANPFTVWEKSKKANIGIDLNMLEERISLTFDVFRELRYDQFVLPPVSQVLGIGAPFINFGRVRNQGFDGSLTYRSNIGNVQFFSTLVVSYAKNKILEMAEAPGVGPNQQRTGHSIGQPFGYNSLGYYTPTDIAQVTQYIADNGSNEGNTQVAVPSYAYYDASLVHAGDLKYEDAGRSENGVFAEGKDGKIDQFDHKPIGNPNLPNTVLGLNLGVSYKGFNMSVLFQGANNYSYLISGNGIEPFQSQWQPIHQEAYKADGSNAATANFPRLSTNFSGIVNSPAIYPSNYWLLNAWYIRLKTVDIGYSLPSNLLPFRVNNARIYMSAYNLLTWNNFSRYQQDPEVSTNSAGDQYINARVINLGVQLGF